MIDVAALSKRFDALMGLDGVSFLVERGQNLGVLGPDGAGKSTLLRCLAGKLRPDEGTIRIGGLRLDRPDHSQVTRKIALLDLSEREMPVLTVAQNVLLGLLERAPSRRTMPSDDERQAALDALSTVDLHAQMGTRVASLDPAARLRLRLACLLVSRPSVLLIDGPFTQLDEPLALDLIGLLNRLKHDRHLTLVCSFREPEYALTFSDHLLGLRMGEPQFFGPVSEITPDHLASIFGTEPSDWVGLPIPT